MDFPESRYRYFLFLIVSHMVVATAELYRYLMGKWEK